MGNFEPSARPPAYQVLAEELRGQILSGRLRPGERLPTEPQLCARSGVSRSTVREALRLLASQHLIVTTRGVTGGSFVARPSPEQISATLSDAMHLMRGPAEIGVHQLLEVREMLEVPGVAVAAQRRTDDDLEAMEAALLPPGVEDVPRRFLAYRSFHAALASAVHNPLYALLVHPLYDFLNEPVIGAVVPPEVWERGFRYHRDVLERVAARDSGGAMDTAREYLRYLRARFADVVAPDVVVNLAAQPAG